MADVEDLGSEMREELSKVSSCSGNCATCSSRCKKYFQPPKALGLPFQELARRIASKLTQFDDIILVLSGKGGVGKSTVAVQVAYYFSEVLGHTVNLLDCDVCGPSAATLTMSADADVNLFAGEAWEPVHQTMNLSIMSPNYLIGPKDTAIILPGTGKDDIISEMFYRTRFSLKGCEGRGDADAPEGTPLPSVLPTQEDCDGEDADDQAPTCGACSAGPAAPPPPVPPERYAPAYQEPKCNVLHRCAYCRGTDQRNILVIDLPPGTSDEQLTAAQYCLRAFYTVQEQREAEEHREGKADTELPPTKLGGGLSVSALVISTPQEVSLQDVRRVLRFCQILRLPVAGVLENMSGFVCPSCNTNTDIFWPSTGGCGPVCEKYNVPFLGKLPICLSLSRACEDGMPWAEYLDMEGGEGDKAAYSKFCAMCDAIIGHEGRKGH